MTTPVLDDPALIYRRALDQERTEWADDEAKPGAIVKWSACECADDCHAFADRAGWMGSQASAYMDVRRAENTGQRAHLVVRETRVVR